MPELTQADLTPIKADTLLFLGHLLGPHSAITDASVFWQEVNADEGTYCNLVEYNYRDNTLILDSGMIGSEIQYYALAGYAAHYDIEVDYV